MRDRVTLHVLWIATAIAILVPSAADPDLWGHLLFGSLLLGGTFAVENGFAYTTPTHPWVNHELLAEGTMALLYRLAGPGGLVALKVGLAIATLAMLWRSAERRSGNAVASALAGIAALVVMAPGFMIRPQLFTLFVLALTLEILDRSDYRPQGWALGLPLLIALWVNVHGGVLAGVGLVAVALGSNAAARAARHDLSRHQLIAAVGLVFAVATALLVNPYGFRLLRFLALDVTPQVPISEWAPVRMFDTSFPSFKLLLVATMLGVAVLRPRLVEVAIVLVTATVALRHQRHIPLFAIAATPLVAASLSHWLRRWPESPTYRSIADLARGGVIAGAVLQLVVAALAVGTHRGTIAVSPAYYPVQALRFLAQNDIVGNVALPFRWGEYALWALPAGTRVAVDGRFTTAYPGSLLADAWSFMSGGEGWDALLERYPTDIVVADRAQAPALLLRDAPEWQYVYSDPVSIVFVRKTERHADLLARFKSGQLVYDRSPASTDFPASGGTVPAAATRFRFAGARDPAFPGQAAPAASARVLAAWRP